MQNDGALTLVLSPYLKKPPYKQPVWGLFFVIFYNGEIAEKCIYRLDQDKIDNESRYDVFYAVITNFDCNVKEIIRINQQRWEIEENFRIMKTEFEARPVYVQRDQLEKKLDGGYTCESLLAALRSMQVTLLPGNLDYTPSYKRTDLTDALHHKKHQRN